MTGRRSRLALTAAVLLVVAGVLTMGVNALYTDSETVSANTFATGDLDLTASPATAAIVYADMIPGDVVVAPITVGNGGSATLRYAMQSTTDEDLLAAQLALTVKAGVTSCTAGGFAADGSVLYGPDFDLGSTTTDAIFGLSATGPDPGDRTLAAGISETLCLRVELPVGSDNSFQGLSSTATFTFRAEQTANNP